MKYRITSPDGKAFDVTAPDGASQDDVLAYAQSQWQAPEVKPAFQEPAWLQTMRTDGTLDPSKGVSDFENSVAGYGAAIPNLYAGIKQRLGLADQAEIDERKRMQAPLMNTKAGAFGNFLGNLAPAAATAFIPAANTVTGAAVIGAGLGAIQPTATGESALTNAEIGAVGGAAGQRLAQGVGSLIANRGAAKLAQGTQNAVRDATMKAGQEAGYIVAPANANPTAWNRLIQGLAGKTATGQRAAILNQATTNRLAREALGIAEDAPLTVETLNGVREQAGQAYETLRQFDEIALDSSYIDDVMKAAKPYMDTAKELPGLASKEAQDVVQMAVRDKVSGNGLIAATRLLRDKADVAYRAGEKELGKLYKGISNAMEDAAERHLAQSGDEAASQAFKGARQLIAKTYSVQNSLNESTGNVIASKLGQQVAKGKPLTGGLKLAGKFSRAFPRETQEVANSSWLQMPGPSPLDWAGGVATSLGTGNPLGMATVAARPLANAVITSKPYQKAMTTPKYTQGLMAKLLKTGTDTRAGRALIRQLTAAGLAPPANALIDALRGPTEGQ